MVCTRRHPNPHDGPPSPGLPCRRVSLTHTAGTASVSRKRRPAHVYSPLHRLRNSHNARHGITFHPPGKRDEAVGCGVDSLRCSVAITHRAALYDKPSTKGASPFHRCPRSGLREPASSRGAGYPSGAPWTPMPLASASGRFISVRTVRRRRLPRSELSWLSRCSRRRPFLRLGPCITTGKLLRAVTSSDRRL